jgi:hypothetical protein
MFAYPGGCHAVQRECESPKSKNAVNLDTSTGSDPKWIVFAEPHTSGGVGLAI